VDDWNLKLILLVHRQKRVSVLLFGGTAVVAVVVAVVVQLEEPLNTLLEGRIPHTFILPFRKQIETLMMLFAICRVPYM